LRLLLFFKPAKYVACPPIRKARVHVLIEHHAGGGSRRFGHVVSAPGWGTHALAPLSFRAASYSGVFTLLPMLTGEGRAHHGEILREATRLVEAGKLAPRVDIRRFALAAVGDAYRALENNDAAGKIVVDISG
jgi:NADPH2:quinone reductase